MKFIASVAFVPQSSAMSRSGLPSDSARSNADLLSP